MHPMAILVAQRKPNSDIVERATLHHPEDGFIIDQAEGFPALGLMLRESLHHPNYQAHDVLVGEIPFTIIYLFE